MSVINTNQNNTQSTTSSSPSSSSELSMTWGDRMDMYDAQKLEQSTKQSKTVETKTKNHEWTEVKTTPKPVIPKPAKLVVSAPFFVPSNVTPKRVSPQSVSPRSRSPKRTVPKVAKHIIPDQETTLIVKNLPYWDTYIIDLLVRFETYGEVRNIDVPRNRNKSSKGIAFVHFESKDSADKAAKLHHYWQDDRKIRVEHVK